jgi:hypothetical protein
MDILLMNLILYVMNLELVLNNRINSDARKAPRTSQPGR